MQIGTFGYMAPEVLTFTQTDSSSAYSVMIDIWAIGVIAVELLLKRHPFTSILDLAGYVHGTKGLELSGRGDAPLSHACVDFLRSMLSPSPANRPSAQLAVAHPWMIVNDAPLAAEES
jgi:serine/threonine protein kinase